MRRGEAKACLQPADGGGHHPGAFGRVAGGDALAPGPKRPLRRVATDHASEGEVSPPVSPLGLPQVGGGQELDRVIDPLRSEAAGLPAGSGVERPRDLARMRSWSVGRRTAGRTGRARTGSRRARPARGGGRPGRRPAPPRVAGCPGGRGAVESGRTSGLVLNREAPRGMAWRPGAKGDRDRPRLDHRTSYGKGAGPVRPPGCLPSGLSPDFAPRNARATNARRPRSDQATHADEGASDSPLYRRGRWWLGRGAAGNDPTRGDLVR